MFYKLWSNLLFIFSSSLLILGFFILKSDSATIMQFNFVQIESCKMDMVIVMDWVAVIFSSAILFISSMVVKFSEEYMGDEQFKTRFLLLILMFVLSMFLLVMSPNLMSVLLGWDGLGLVSYCLVIYYQNPRSFNAGMLTILSNRIGDVMILVSISILASLGTWNFIPLNLSILPAFAIIFIMLAAMTKSAQIPFSAWLPAAMAAPTPVSALVHSSTLVTAGVFLLIRFHNIFHNNLAASLLLISSCLTMFMAGVGAAMETDMKKVIALSTLSQLGVMMLALALDMWTLAYFHMITHAMFKALLFLCAGFVIHNTKNNQDIRKMGTLIFPSPLISAAILISSLALMGFPFLAGFYSKDLILEQSMNSLFFLFTMMLMLMSFGTTMVYSIRLPFMSLINNSNLPKTIMIQETPMMKSSIISLSMMAISIGSLLGWLILPSPPFILLQIFPKMLSIILISSGILLSLSLWIMKLKMESLKSLNKTFFGSMWFLPTLSTSIFSNYLMKINKIKSSESGWNEFLGAQGIFLISTKNSSYISKLQNNQLQTFMLSFMIIIIMMFILYLL